MFQLPSEITTRRAGALTQGQKAAVIVRLLVMGGADPGIADLPPDQQRRLVREMSALRLVDRETLARTVAEFSAELDAVGLHFPREVDRILQALDGSLSQDVVDALLSETGGDPALLGDGAWANIAARDDEGLLALIEGESDEVCAVVLFKLPPTRAAALLATLPPERADAVSRALAGAEGLTPDAEARVGAALGARRGGGGASTGAAKRVADMLNATTASLRAAVLARLEATDAGFAERVRAAVFGWENIPERLDARDVPKVLRGIDTSVAVAALTADPDGPVATFLLGAISSRLADQMREQVQEAAGTSRQDAEAAMARVVSTVRDLEDEGVLSLRTPEG
jgi:flagellar motor switch protein FliG